MEPAERGKFVAEGKISGPDKDNSGELYQPVS